jgi:hypothetical protein
VAAVLGGVASRLRPPGYQHELLEREERGGAWERLEAADTLASFKSTVSQLQAQSAAPFVVGVHAWVSACWIHSMKKKKTKT